MAFTPKNRDQEYWNNQEEKKANKYYGTDKKAISEKNKLYTKHRKSITNKVNAFYGKYGEVQESPVIDSVGVSTETSNKLVVTRQQANVVEDGETRLTTLKKDINTDIKALYATQIALLTKYLIDVAENNYMETIFTYYRGIGIGTSFKLLNENALNQLIKSPIQGSSFSKRSNFNRNRMAFSMNQVIEDGITKGLSVSQMTQRITQEFVIPQRDATTMIITNLSNTYNQSNLLAMQQNGQDSYLYIATLDDRTTPECQELDGQVLPISEAQQGLNVPPLHYNCRSTISQVINMENVTRIARDADGNSYTVPATMTYEQWLEERGF